MNIETATLLFDSRKALAVYADANEFVLDSTMVFSLEDTRKKVYALIDAFPVLWVKGDDRDRDLVADQWDEITDAFSTTIAANGGATIKVDGKTKPNPKAEQYVKARTSTSEGLKDRFFKLNLWLNIAHGAFEVEPMTSEEILKYKGVKPSKARADRKKGGKMIDKGAGAQTGTHKAQAPSPAAKSLSYLDQAASLIQLMNLDDLETHLIAVKAAIAASKKETAQAAAAAAAAAKAAAAKAAKAATSNAGRVAAAAAKAAKAKAAADKAAKAAAVKADRANGSATSAANAEKSAAIIAQQRKDKAAATRARRKAANASTPAINATL